MRLHSTINSFLIPLILAGSIALVFADEQTNQGVAAAKAWLGLVDAKQYRESWVQAAPFFKEKVKAEDWERMASSARGPLGDMKTRELIGAQYMTTLPGVPAGEYVVMQFKTAFQNKADAVETITPMKDPKGEWRVSGYFIK